MVQRNTADSEGRGRPDLAAWRVEQVQHGWVYIFRHGKRFKIGKTTTPAKRLREARTWIPDIEVFGIKPFWHVSYHERLLHCGFAQFWIGGEWFEFPDDSYDELFETFDEFYEADPDWNTIDFVYWFNSSGLAEVAAERRGRSIRKWLKEAGMGG